MAKYISLGEFNKKYFFILGSIIVKIILTFISGFTPYLTPNDTIFIFGFSSNFFSHPIISHCFQYFSLLVIGVILEIILYYKTKSKNNSALSKRAFSELSQSMRTKSFSTINKTFNNDKNNNKKNLIKIFLVCTLYYFSKIIITSLDNLGYNRIKYWPLEYIFLYIFSKKILKRIIYRHQKLSLTILLIVCTTIYIINSIIPLSNKDCSKIEGEKLNECKILNMNIYNDIINKFGWYLIPIIILIYLSTMVSNAYTSIAIKWFIDIKYITIYRILIYTGIIGLFFSSILLFIFSYIPCSKEINNLSNHICKINYQDNIFYENYRTLSNIEINSNFFIDIFIIIPLFIISSFLSIFFELSIIKDLDPFYLIPIDSIYFLIYEIIDYSITYPITNLFRNLKFICMISSDSIGIFLACIYLEIFELHFCYLDLYLRRFIIQREQEEKINLIGGINEENENDKEIYLDSEESNASINSYEVKL